MLLRTVSLSMLTLLGACGGVTASDGSAPPQSSANAPAPDAPAVAPVYGLPACRTTANTIVIDDATSSTPTPRVISVEDHGWGAGVGFVSGVARTIQIGSPNVRVTMATTPEIGRALSAGDFDVAPTIVIDDGGQQCDAVSGRFTIHELTFEVENPKNLSSISASFEANCANGTRLLGCTTFLAPKPAGH